MWGLVFANSQDAGLPSCQPAAPTSMCCAERRAIHMAGAAHSRVLNATQETPAGPCCDVAGPCRALHKEETPIAGSKVAMTVRQGVGRPPDSSVVRQTSNSAVAGLPMATAPSPLSGRRRWPKFSAREVSAQVSTSGSSEAHAWSAPRSAHGQDFRDAGGRTIREICAGMSCVDCTITKRHSRTARQGYG